MQAPRKAFLLALAATLLAPYLMAPTTGGYPSQPSFVSVKVSGNTQSATYTGNGAALTNLDASHVTSNTLADARLSGNVALLNGGQNFSTPPTISSKAICLADGTNCPSTGGGTTITVQGTVVNFNLIAYLGGTPGGPVTVTLTVATGAQVLSLTSKTPAMDLSGLPSGSTVNLINNGYILARGGDGGHGASGQYPGSGATMNAARGGQPGGDAIKGPGTGNTFNVNNGSGFIWGGGGGGGGGGAGISNVAGGNNVANAGGGGAGAGGGKGGEAGDTWDFVNTVVAGSDGSDSGTGPNGTFGAGGSNAAKNTATAANGGAGGDWGANGSAGNAAGSEPILAPPGGAGLAGNAVNNNGVSVTFSSGGTAPHVKGAVI